MRPFVAMLFFYSVVAALLAVGSSLPTFGQTCPTTQVPPTNTRGVNRLNRSSNTPLYRLEIVSHSGKNHKTSESLTYHVQITAKNDAFFFSDAKISLASKSPCEAGSLTFDPHDFFDAKQSEPTCPRLLLTNRKLPMGDLPSLSWKPPACGCVQFRAVVISVHNVYYADNEDVQNGPLTQTVCVHQKATRELYFNTLCQVTEKHSAAEILSRPAFLHRHQLEARWMDKHGLEMGLELRRSDNKLCCSRVSMESKLSCFDDSRRRRVDRFCEDGYPDVPFTSFRVTHMRDREKRCCFLLGEHRYRCFAENSELARGPEVTLLDFSQDETDPVNDLAEFAFPHDADVIKIIGTVTFGEKRGIIHEEGNNDSADNGEKEEGDDDDDTADQNKAVKSSKKAPTVTDETELQLEVARDFSPASAKASPHTHLQSPVEDIRSHTKIATDHSPKLTSSERRKTRRNNGEPENWVSAERLGSRRASSREYTADGRRVNGAEGRRASNERAGRKRTSGERYKPATEGSSWGVPGYEDTFSRGTGLSRERQALSSAERRSRAKGSAQRRHDWAEVREPDFEDQGGKSVAVTLDKLQKKMERLLMRRQCCEAGAVAGRPVYGWFSPVRKECEHSGQKHVQALDVTSGLRSCLEQFVKCCIELAVSGPVVTSSEFRENQFLFANNLKKLGPVGGLSGLDRRGDEWSQTPARRHPEEIARDVPGRESLEAYELESEKRFSSMRTIEVAPKDEDEEKDGPKRFDEVDNDDEDKYFDIFDRKDETVNKVAGKAEGDAEVVNAVDTKSATTEHIDKSGETVKPSTQSNEKKQKQDGKSNEETNKEKHKNPVAKDRSKEKQDGGSSNQSAKMSSTNTDDKQKEEYESNEEKKKVGHKDTVPKETRVSDLVDSTEKKDGDDESNEAEKKVGHKDTVAKETQVSDLVDSAEKDDDGDKSNEEERARKAEEEKKTGHKDTVPKENRVSDLVDSTEKEDGDSGSQSTELRNTNGHKQKQVDESKEEANKKQNKHTVTKGNIDRETDLVNSSEKQDGDSSSQSTKLKTNHGKKHKQDDKSDEEANRKHHKDTVTGDNLDRVSDPADSMERRDSYSSRQHEASLLAKTSGGRSRQTRNHRAGGQSKVGKTSSREARHSTSRGTSRERQQYSHTFYTNRGSYKLAPLGKIGTEDSREMAAAHVRKFMGALDSKEMVDAYRKTNLESTDVINDGPSQRSTRRKKYNRQRWYYRR